MLEDEVEVSPRDLEGRATADHASVASATNALGLALPALLVATGSELLHVQSS